MEQHISTGKNNNEELSFKEVLIILFEWWKYIKSKWVTVLIFGLLGGGIGLSASFLIKPKYVGELTFVLESDKSSNPLGAYMNVASQFGLDLGGSSTGIFEGDNVLEFLRSRLIVERTLLSPVVVNNKSISLADWYISFNDLRQSWEEKPALKNISFPPEADRHKFTRLQDSILYNLFNKILKSHLSVKKTDKKLSFIDVQCVSSDEIFSKTFTEILVKKATDFYIETKTIRAKTNVDRLQGQADTMEILLNKKTYSAALIQDLNANPAKQIASIPAELALRDKLVLQTMYGEVIKNLELSKLMMVKETPVIQIVDSPILPLEKIKLGKLKGIIIGGFVGGFLIIAFLTIKKILKALMEG